jgi:hypothetical protein
MLDRKQGNQRWKRIDLKKDGKGFISKKMEKGFDNGIGSSQVLLPFMNIRCFSFVKQIYLDIF